MQKRTWGVLGLAALVLAVVAFQPPRQAPEQWEYLEMRHITAPHMDEGHVIRYVALIHAGLWLQETEVFDVQELVDTAGFEGTQRLLTGTVWTNLFRLNLQRQLETELSLTCPIWTVHIDLANCLGSAGWELVTRQSSFEVPPGVSPADIPLGGPNTARTSASFWFKRRLQ